VGREREQGALAALLDDAGQGRARVVLLSGEAGVGKSRLANELVQVARRRRASVLQAQAYEVEAGRPYGPWIDALRQVPRTLVGSRLAAELAMLVPEWAAEPAPRPSEEQLFGAVCELLAARAHSAPPVLLLFDDVHWLDEPSCRLLHYVARFSRHRPLLVLLAARDGELFDNAASMRVLRSLRRDGLLAELPVGPLAAEAIERIAAHLRAGASAERIYAESAGNALFAIELARAAASATEALSSTLSALIRDRVEALPALAADVLRWAAVLGSGLPVERLELMAELPGDQVALALETLQRHALLQAQASARPEGAGYAFVHEVVRRAVYAELSEPRRRVMHRRVVERLEPLLARDETLAADVVHHGALAGKPEVSARACLRAAERCVKLFASKDAEALVRRGFYHAQRLALAERVKLELELWRVQIDARRPEEGEGVGQELQRLATLALDHGQEDAASLAFHLLSWLRWEQNASSEALTFSLRAEALSRNLTDRERSAALGEAARCLALVDGDLGAAEALLLEAEARAARSGVQTAALPDARGMLAWHRGELRAAALAFAQANQQAMHDTDRSNQFQALEHELGVLLELGELGAARDISAQLLELSSKLRGGSEAPVARVLAALLDYVSDPPRAEPELEAALAALRLADVKQRLAFAQIHAAEADLRHARVASAAVRASEALRAATALSRASDVALARSVLARAASVQGYSEALARELDALSATPLAPLSARARQCVEDALGPRPSPAPALAPRAKGKRTHGNRGGRTPVV
jgi:predicted ATPase